MTFSMTGSFEKGRVVQDKFVSTLCHDLRNSIGTAQMATQILERSLNDPAAVDPVHLYRKSRSALMVYL